MNLKLYCKQIETATANKRKILQVKDYTSKIICTQIYAPTFEVFSN